MSILNSGLFMNGDCMLSGSLFEFIMDYLKLATSANVSSSDSEESSFTLVFGDRLYPYPPPPITLGSRDKGET